MTTRNWSPVDWTVLFVPLVTGFGSSILCPVRSTSGSCVKARPPGFVFGIVWTFLYALLGLSWVFSRQVEDGGLTDLFFSILVVMLCAWVAVYACGQRKRSALYVLLLTNMWNFLTWSFVQQQSIWSGCLFAPYTVWCLFAMYLNAQDLECSPTVAT